jgi:hypothetical protein
MAIGELYDEELSVLKKLTFASRGRVELSTRDEDPVGVSSGKSPTAHPWPQKLATSSATGPPRSSSTLVSSLISTSPSFVKGAWITEALVESPALDPPVKEVPGAALLLPIFRVPSMNHGV